MGERSTSMRWPSDGVRPETTCRSINETTGEVLQGPAREIVRRLLNRIERGDVVKVWTNETAAT